MDALHPLSFREPPSGVQGQIKTLETEPPSFCPTRKLDFELEMAFVTCSNTTLGNSISVKEAEDHIIGLVLFNDWSARDIQQWEYVPLVPSWEKISDQRFLPGS